MTLRSWKIANIFIWSGVTLLLLGIGLNYPLFQPCFATLLKTRQLAAAPSFEESGAEIPIPQLAADAPLASRPVVTVTGPATPEKSPPAPDARTVTSTPLPPTATIPVPSPSPAGTLPQYIRIPSIGLAAPIVPVKEKALASSEAGQITWGVPDWEAVGWHNSSALLGESGNTVLNGHNTTRGEVFRDLYQVEEGAYILLTGEDQKTYPYHVAHIYILEERGQPLEVRHENAQYIQTTLDKRVTLVTCHPYASTRYRLIVIARPTAKLNLSAGRGE
ncbi:MAG TPA: sortase [Thermoflexia bacterium]|nr:sortase [Thermoflexia bacterium]